MKEMRSEASHAGYSGPELEQDERRRRPRGEDSALSNRDVAAFRGKRVGELDAKSREEVADAALSDDSGALPHKAEMESRFGRSFDHVEVAGGEPSRDTLHAVGADGVTRGNSVAFREASPSQEVVAHELTHVVQSESSGGATGAGAEQEAFGAEVQFRAGGPIEVGAGHSTGGQAHFRDPDDAIREMFDLPEPSFSPFGQFPEPFAAKDETPIEWSNHSQAPPDPFELVDCTLKSHPPARPKEESDKPDHSREHPSHHRRPERLDDSVVFASNRDSYWSAFEAVCLEAQGTHDAMGADLELFRHAERDEELKALGFILPGKGWNGDLGALAEEQEVPKKGGAEVGELFDGSNQLKLNKQDHRAIDQTSKATAKGKGTTEDSMLETFAADNQLKGAIAKVKGAADGVSEAAGGLRSAVLEIEYEQWKDQAKEDQAEIDALKQEAQDKKDVVDAVFGLASGIVFAASGDLGDAINQVGVVAGIVLSHTNDDKIRRAEHKLAASENRMRNARAARLQSDLEKAKSAVSKALHGVDEARAELLQAMTARRQAYNQLGTSAAAQVDGPKASKNKVAAILAAIPIVEIVVGRAQSLAAKKAPVYTKDAGKGLGIASYHGYGEASKFMRVAGELNYCNPYFGFIALDWEERRQALLGIKERIGGPRPEEPAG